MTIDMRRYHKYLCIYCEMFHSLEKIILTWIGLANIAVANQITSYDTVMDVLVHRKQNDKSNAVTGCMITVFLHASDISGR